MNLLILYDHMKKVIVTTSWDDGHVLDLKMAELLKKYNIKGTFYVSPRHHEFKSSELLNSIQIVQLGMDFEIGSHTMIHPRLGRVSAEESEKEMRESKHYLEGLLGVPVKSFCYPSGDYNELHIRQVGDAGFKLARTVKRYSFNKGDSSLELPTTIHAYNHWSDLWDIMLFAKFNPLNIFRYYQNWDFLAKAMFDRVLHEGGVFHLWGHSWEIEKNNHWEKLEGVLDYISNRREIEYLTNVEII